jgi:hypothetical protein
MPYIPEEQRRRLDPCIDRLGNEIRELAAKQEGDYEGLLNYSVTRLALKVIPERRYKHIARVTGTLTNVIQEFYRRFGAKYEDEAIARHGDVFPE